MKILSILNVFARAAEKRREKKGKQFVHQIKEHLEKNDHIEITATMRGGGKKVISGQGIWKIFGETGVTLFDKGKIGESLGFDEVKEITIK